MSKTASSPDPEKGSRDLHRQVATGLRDPVELRAANIAAPIAVKLSDHAQSRWHERVLRDCSRERAMLLLLELLRSGKEVWSRRHPYRWVAGNNRNLVYFSIGHDVMLPAEDLDDDRFELEIVTCLTNPRSRHPLPRRLDPVHSTNRSSRHRYPRR